MTLSTSLQVTHTRPGEEWEQFIIQLVSRSTRDQDLWVSRVLFLSYDKYTECSSLLDWGLKEFKARDTLYFYCSPLQGIVLWVSGAHCAGDSHWFSITCEELTLGWGEQVVQCPGQSHLICNTGHYALPAPWELVVIICSLQSSFCQSEPNTALGNCNSQIFLYPMTNASTWDLRYMTLTYADLDSTSSLGLIGDGAMLPGRFIGDVRLNYDKSWQPGEKRRGAEGGSMWILVSWSSPSALMSFWHLITASQKLLIISKLRYLFGLTDCIQLTPSHITQVLLHKAQTISGLLSRHARA